MIIDNIISQIPTSGYTAGRVYYMFSLRNKFNILSSLNHVRNLVKKMFGVFSVL